MKNESKGTGPLSHGFHLMAKPSGPACNISCEYCFYSEKKTFFGDRQIYRMSVPVLEAYVREYINSQPGSSVVFDWQGGEPTLMGIDFFRMALSFQAKYGKGKQISNSIQTNGTLIDEAWCSFFSKNGFLVGLSLDGPEYLHDINRVYKDGTPTFARVFRSLKMMQDKGVEVNILATVNRNNSLKPLEVYRFFRESGVRFIQFIPIVERSHGSATDNHGLSLAPPPSIGDGKKTEAVTPSSVEPDQYGEFLVQIFDEWIRKDVGSIFVMNFEWSLCAWAGLGPGVCYLSKRCGNNLIIEHNGDVYSCDHYMYPDYRLGNVLEDDLKSMVESKKQVLFGLSKEDGLPGYCRSCEFLFVCNGGCPKHRFAFSPDNEKGLNYLCPGFKKFYSHINPSMKRLLEMIKRGAPASQIMG